VNRSGQKPARHRFRHQFRSLGVSLLLFAFAWAVPTFTLDDDPSDDPDGQFEVSVLGSGPTIRLVCFSREHFVPLMVRTVAPVSSLKLLASPPAFHTCCTEHSRLPAFRRTVSAAL